MNLKKLLLIYEESKTDEGPTNKDRESAALKNITDDDDDDQIRHHTHLR